MSTMQAVLTDRDGNMTVSTVERPMMGPTQVLVRVRAAGVNPADARVRMEGGDGALFPPGDSLIQGWDLAGEVVEVGFGVTRFTVGDRVFGMARFPAPGNALAEYVAVGSREVARIPDSVSYVEAGAMPMAGLTAWQSIVDALDIGAGDRILIHAASGGVGHLAVQLAKARGAEVWATASAKNHEAVRALGADHLIDYRTERFEDVATEMDAVLDLAGKGDTSVRSVQTLRRGGAMLNVAGGGDPVSPEMLAEAGVTARTLLVEPDYASLEALAEMMAAGTLRVIVGDTKPLAQVRELLTTLDAGGPMGKLVATSE